MEFYHQPSEAELENSHLDFTADTYRAGEPGRPLTVHRSWLGLPLFEAVMAWLVLILLVVVVVLVVIVVVKMNRVLK